LKKLEVETVDLLRRNGTSDCPRLRFASCPISLRHKRFHFHFTPTYGSWMNLVERWFSALTTKKLQRSAHRNVKALAADIRAWVETWNEDPKPFIWHKSADEILERLAGYCAAVNTTEK